MSAAAGARCSCYYNEKEETPALKLLLLSLLSLSGFICIYVCAAAQPHAHSHAEWMQQCQQKGPLQGAVTLGCQKKLLTAGAVPQLLWNTSPAWLFHCRCGPKALVWVFRGYQVGMSLPQDCGVHPDAGGPSSHTAVPVSMAA